MKTPWLAALTLMLAVVSPALAQDIQSERETLVGLAGVKVVVEKIDPDAERDGLTRSALLTDVELKLRQVGIPVLSEMDWKGTPGWPYLYLEVGFLRNVSAPPLVLYAFHISLHLNQEVRLERNLKIGGIAATWQARGMVGTTGPNDLRKVRETVRDMVDEFINAYLAANPKR
jgi:hypothetical protein